MPKYLVKAEVWKYSLLEEEIEVDAETEEEAEEKADEILASEYDEVYVIDATEV